METGMSVLTADCLPTLRTVSTCLQKNLVRGNITIVDSRGHLSPP